MESTESFLRSSCGCLKHMILPFLLLLFCWLICVFFLIRILKHISRADCRFEWCCYDLLANLNVFKVFVVKEMFLACFVWCFFETFHSKHRSLSVIRSALVEQSTPSSHVIVDEVASVSNISFTEPLVINIS